MNWDMYATGLEMRLDGCMSASFVCSVFLGVLALVGRSAGSSERESIWAGMKFLIAAVTIAVILHVVSGWVSDFVARGWLRPEPAANFLDWLALGLGGVEYLVAGIGVIKCWPVFRHVVKG